MCIVFYLPLSFFLYILLHKKEEQKISTFDLRYNQPAQFVLDIHQDNIKYTTLKSNLSFFFPAFYVQENNKPLNLEEITARFDFDFTYKIRNLSSTETAIKMNIINCEEKYPGISDKLKQSSLKNSICLEADQGYEIQGEQLTKDIVDFKFIAINLKKKELI